jgi:hypothetical protein
MTMPRRKTTGKRPAMMFYYGDYKRDPELGMCSLATRGAWIELFSAMGDAQRGSLVGTVEDLARLARCTPGEMRDALVELHSKNAAIVAMGERRGRDLVEQWTANGHANGRLLDTDLTGVCTVVSRRLQREEEARNAARDRQNRRRHRRDSSAVTLVSRENHAPSSSSSAVSSDLPSEDPPVVPQGTERAGDQQPGLFDAPTSVPNQPPGPESTPPKKGDATAMVDALLEELSAARIRVRSACKPMKLTDAARKHIAARLADGYEPDDVRHVIAVCEAECRRYKGPENQDPFQWFDAVSPFRPDNFERKRARAAPATNVTPLRAERQKHEPLPGRVYGGDFIEAMLREAEETANAAT